MRKRNSVSSVTGNSWAFRIAVDSEARAVLISLSATPLTDCEVHDSYHCIASGADRRAD